MSRGEYIELIHNTARKIGLQKTLKRRRVEMNQRISDCYQRFERNGGHYDGRNLVPKVPACDLPKLVSKLGKIERQIVENRKLIRELETRRIAMKVHHTISSVFDRVVKSKPKTTPRDLVKKIMSYQGLFLRDNGEVTGKNGKLLGLYGNDARLEGDQLIWTYKPLQSLDFIMLDINVKVQP